MKTTRQEQEIKKLNEKMQKQLMELQKEIKGYNKKQIKNWAMVGSLNHLHDLLDEALGFIKVQ